MSDAERKRAFWIAVQARRYALLAERPDLLYPEPGLRAERVVQDEARSPLDVMLLAGVDEAGRLCASAVAALSRDAPQAKPILDLLAVLPADYLLGIYFALPEERRGKCEADPVWAYHLRRIPEGVTEAALTLRSTALDNPADVGDQVLDPQEAADFRQFSEELMRRELGMPHDLSEAEEALALAGAGALADVLGDGG